MRFFFFHSEESIQWASEYVELRLKELKERNEKLARAIVGNKQLSNWMDMLGLTNSSFLLLRTVKLR